MQQREIPITDSLRRAAMEAAKAERINWVLLRTDEAYFQNFDDNQSDWNIRRVAARGPYVLYRLDWGTFLVAAAAYRAKRDTSVRRFLYAVPKPGSSNERFVVISRKQ